MNERMSAHDAIKQGVADHEQEVKGQKNEDQDKPEISKEESILNFNAGLEIAKNIIENLKSEFIGVETSTETHGQYDYSNKLLNKDGEDEIIRLLSDIKVNNNFDISPLYDDILARYGGTRPNKDYSTFSLNGKDLFSYQTGADYDNETFEVAGKPVTHDDYEAFEAEVKKMLEENLKQRGAEDVNKRELPIEIKNKVEFDYNLKIGEVVFAGVTNSGHINGTLDSAKAYDLIEFKNGNKVKKDIKIEDKDNSSFDFTIEPNTIVICKYSYDQGGHGYVPSEHVYIVE